MQIFKTPFSAAYWRAAAGELKNYRTLVFSALMVAACIVLSHCKIPLGENLSLSVTFLARALCALVCGPVAAVLFGAAEDTLSFFPSSGGYPYFPGYMLTTILGCVVYALFFYRAKITWRRIILAKIITNIQNIFLGSLWSAILYSKGYLYYMTTSAVKNALYLPLQILMLGFLFQSALVGVLCAVVASLLLSLVFAYFVLKLKSDLILTGIALNLMASGGTVFLLSVICGDKGVSTSMASKVVPSIEIPLIKDIPILGEILSGHNVLTYVALLSVVVVYVLVNKSPLGLRIRSVGENPDAAESVGISVVKTRFIALMITGILSGLGGAFMSMGYVSWFARDMAAGRGYIALAAQNLGNATPIGTCLASYLFGIADALSSSLQILSVPAEFIQMIPYVTTVIGLIVYAAYRKKQTQKKQAAL